MKDMKTFMFVTMATLALVSGLDINVPRRLEMEMIQLQEEMILLKTTVTEMVENLAMELTQRIHLNVEDRLKSLEERMKICEDTRYSTDEAEEMATTKFSLLNDTNIEERVQALEFQMANVQDDVTSLNTEVSDLDEDVENQFLVVEQEITVIQQDQSFQDQRIFNVEEETPRIYLTILISVLLINSSSFPTVQHSIQKHWSYHTLVHFALQFPWYFPVTDHSCYFCQFVPSCLYSMFHCCIYSSFSHQF